MKKAMMKKGMKKMAAKKGAKTDKMPGGGKGAMMKRLEGKEM